MISYREQLLEYSKKKYNIEPEYLWNSYPGYAVLRHSDNNKWFGIIMDVSKNKLGLQGEERVDILNVKMSDPFWADSLVSREGYFRGYHISRGNWISILLDGTIPFEDIIKCLNESYITTSSTKNKQTLRSPKEWLIPANPKYYDIVHAFDNTNVIDWKQGSGIKKEDTVFIYVGTPISAILYKCKVTDTNIPYNYTDGNLNIRQLMKIELQKRYHPDKFTLGVLKVKYDIYAVRGPRGVPHSLSEALKL